MDGFAVWPIIGLAFGTVLGVVGAFGGLYAFLLVLVLGVIGFLVGRVLEGGLDVSSLGARRR
jgi:hypothetical protein